MYYAVSRKVHFHKFSVLRVASIQIWKWIETDLTYNFSSQVRLAERAIEFNSTTSIYLIASNLSIIASGHQSIVESVSPQLPAG